MPQGEKVLTIVLIILYVVGYVSFCLSRDWVDYNRRKRGLATLVGMVMGFWIGWNGLNLWSLALLMGWILIWLLYIDSKILRWAISPQRSQWRMACHGLSVFLLVNVSSLFLNFGTTPKWQVEGDVAPVVLTESTQQHMKGAVAARMFADLTADQWEDSSRMRAAAVDGRIRVGPTERWISHQPEIATAWYGEVKGIHPGKAIVCPGLDPLATNPDCILIQVTK